MSDTGTVWIAFEYEKESDEIKSVPEYSSVNEEAARRWIENQHSMFGKTKDHMLLALKLDATGEVVDATPALVLERERASVVVDVDNVDRVGPVSIM